MDSYQSILNGCLRIWISEPQISGRSQYYKTLSIFYCTGPCPNMERLPVNDRLKVTAHKNYNSSSRTLQASGPEPTPSRCPDAKSGGGKKITCPEKKFSKFVSSLRPNLRPKFRTTTFSFSGNNLIFNLSSEAEFLKPGLDPIEEIWTSVLTLG